MTRLTNIYWRFRSKLPPEHQVRERMHRDLRKLLDRLVTPLEMEWTRQALRRLRGRLEEAPPKETHLAIREAVSALGHLLPSVTEEHLDDLRLLRIAFATVGEKPYRAGLKDPWTEGQARAIANLLASVESTLRERRR